MTEKECDTNMNSECRHITKFINCIELFMFIIVQKLEICPLQKIWDVFQLDILKTTI
jgi:hypothetical protein